MREGAVSEGAIVVGRGGWLRLPRSTCAGRASSTRATARVEGERIVVTSADVGAAPAPVGEEGAALPAAAAGRRRAPARTPGS